ncbi:MAG: Gfo/Idh/MocA family oxidoreductase [bacterium]|nr:Gfo/Idh/MocA family oxidoreductase [bacterium]
MSAGKLRYAVIGIQGIGRYHVRTSQEQPQVELVALVDVDAATVRRQAAELGVQPFTDHRDLLAAGLVDAVSIATPHRHLAPIGPDCLAAGLHILVEKPFATRISDARTMNELAKQRGLQIGVAYQYRTLPPGPGSKRFWIVAHWVSYSRASGVGLNSGRMPTTPAARGGPPGRRAVAGSC